MTTGAFDAYARTGARLSQARRAAGLSQKALAERLGTSLFMVDDFERGRRDPGPFLSGVAQATGTPLATLVGQVDASLAPTSTSRTGGVAHARHEFGMHNLVLAAIVLLVTIRFFTEVVPVLPRAANFVDIPIFLVAVVVVATQAPVRTGNWYFSTASLIGAFLLLSLVSVVVNIGRVEPAPVVVFLYGFLAPIALYAVTYRVWPPGNAAALSRTLVGLGIVQLVVVLSINLPTFVERGTRTT